MLFYYDPTMKTAHFINALGLVILFLDKILEGLVISSFTYRVLKTTIHHATRISHFKRATFQVIASREKDLYWNICTCLLDCNLFAMYIKKCSNL